MKLQTRYSVQDKYTTTSNSKKIKVEHFVWLRTLRGDGATDSPTHTCT